MSRIIGFLMLVSIPIYAIFIVYKESSIDIFITSCIETLLVCIFILVAVILIYK